jgi:predicted protein tyrosine phosphatase
VIRRIIFVSRIAAENTIGWDNWAVISITEPGSSFGEARLLDGWFAVHRANFHDVDPARPCGEPHVLMNERHAKGIVAFIHEVAPNVEGILVHCKAGVSRSAAVAKWIADTYDVPFPKKYDAYNRYVYAQLQEAHSSSKC